MRGQPGMQRHAAVERQASRGRLPIPCRSTVRLPPGHPLTGFVYYKPVCFLSAVPMVRATGDGDRVADDAHDPAAVAWKLVVVGEALDERGLADGEVADGSIELAKHRFPAADSVDAGFDRLGGHVHRATSVLGVGAGTEDGAVIGPSLDVVVIHGIRDVGKGVAKRDPRTGIGEYSGLFDPCDSCALPEGYVGRIKIVAAPVGACEVLLMQ